MDLDYMKDPYNLPCNRPEWIKVRGFRQQRASALVTKNISNNHQQERKWANGDFVKMAATGQIFGNSLPGNFPAWVPTDAAAQPPARHGPFFQYLRPLVRRFTEWLAHSASRARRQTPAIEIWWP
eukprot:9215646-Pyramimonas_sp.AAC.1